MLGGSLPFTTLDILLIYIFLLSPIFFLILTFFNFILNLKRNQNSSKIEKIIPCLIFINASINAFIIANYTLSDINIFNFIGGISISLPVLLLIFIFNYLFILNSKKIIFIVWCLYILTTIVYDYYTILL